MNTTGSDGVDYGPLTGLLGVWKGSEGVDIAPEPDGDENNPYFETIVFEAAGDVTNAEEQTMAVVYYRQQVSRKSDRKVFHDQVGYWLWDADTGNVIQTLSIPRAVTLLAGGRALHEDDATVFEVKSGDGDWDIAQAPFMRENASTTAYSLRLELKGDVLRYREETTLDIYDRQGYSHTDENTLRRQP